MELRELRAFVAAAQELHFGRAADRLYLSTSTMSELIRRLELKLGAPLFIRTTRRVTLTDAGAELLGRAEAILELVDQAAEAVGAVAGGDAGVVRLGLTPPAAPVIAPFLVERFTASRPGMSVEVGRMWLPDLAAALGAGTVDAAITCGGLGVDGPAVTTCALGSEPLLVGLRAGDPLADAESVELEQLSGRALGMHPPHLFPAWDRAQRSILDDACLSPPVAELGDTDLSARRWTRQSEVDWIMLTPSLLDVDERTVVRPVPGRSVPFTLSWPTQSVHRPAVRRFVESSLDGQLPDGWLAPDTEAPG